MLFQKSVMMSMEFGFSNISHMEEVTMDMAYRAQVKDLFGGSATSCHTAN